MRTGACRRVLPTSRLTLPGDLSELSSRTSKGDGVGSFPVVQSCSGWGGVYGNAHVQRSTESLFSYSMCHGIDAPELQIESQFISLFF